MLIVCVFCTQLFQSYLAARQRASPSHPLAMEMELFSACNWRKESKEGLTTGMYLDGCGGKGRQNGTLVAQEQGGDAEIPGLNVIELQDRQLKALVGGAVVGVDNPIFAEGCRGRAPGTLQASTAFCG